jgi:Ner family transcriptional regulator
MARSGWHSEDIKTELRKRFGEITRLSENWGHHRSAITNTLRNPAFSKPVERRIADALGVPLHVLWPDRWDAEGVPRPRSQLQEHKRLIRTGDSKKRRAA